METNQKNIMQFAYKEGYTDYELFIFIFLKHFSFLVGIGKYGGYQLSSYSWIAYERQIEFYSIENKITIVFLIEGEFMEVYFEKNKLLFKDRWFLKDIIKSKKLNFFMDEKIQMGTIDTVFAGYAEFFKAHLIPILEGKEWK